jgi:hypothetical protein
MLSRKGVEAKHLRFFVPSLLRMTGIFILLGTLNVHILRCVDVADSSY